MADARSIIIRPIVSERSYDMIELNRYTFEVAKGARKIEIAKAVEEIFDVKVLKVNDGDGQVILDRENRLFGVDTPRTAGFFAEAGARTVGPLTAKLDGKTPAAVWVSALDAEPIASSRRLLLTHVADVQDEGTVYADATKKVLLQWGRLPHLMRRSAAEVTLAFADARPCTVYALAADGTGGIDVKLVDGLRGLKAGEAAAAGEAAGRAWGSGFAAAVAKAAPWLIGLYTLLNPASGSDALGDNTLIDENGNLTAEAQQYGFVKDKTGEIVQDRTQIINDAAQKAWDLYRSNQLTQAGMEELRSAVLNDNLFNDLIKQFSAARAANPENWKSLEDLDLTEWLKGIEPPKVPVDPEAPADAGQKLSEEIGTVTVPVVLVPSLGGESVNKTQQRRRNANSPFGFANGLPNVPFDGWYFLHQNEQVVPAREVASRNFSSNMYVEKMIMNNGQDAEGRASRIAAENQRVMSGFGS